MGNKELFFVKKKKKKEKQTSVKRYNFRKTQLCPDVVVVVVIVVVVIVIEWFDTNKKLCTDLPCLPEFML